MYFEYPPGATPIDPNEADGLIPKDIMLQSELNELEYANIVDAKIWLFEKRNSALEILTIDFIKLMHKKMFNRVWRWAGQFRQTDKNIGCFWLDISTQLKLLCDDTTYQLQGEVFTIDEIAIRFHHRLVSIHCFPNGNGRHARMITDYLLTCLNCLAFSWGKSNLTDTSLARKQYIQALKLADTGEYKELLTFARS